MLKIINKNIAWLLDLWVCCLKDFEVAMPNFKVQESRSISSPSAAKRGRQRWRTTNWLASINPETIADGRSILIDHYGWISSKPLWMFGESLVPLRSKRGAPATPPCCRGPPSEQSRPNSPPRPTGGFGKQSSTPRSVEIPAGWWLISGS